MTGRDLIDSGRHAATIAAVNISTSLVTDDQVELLANLYAGKSASEIRSIMLSVSPAERDRTGIVLPFMTTGPYQAFAQHAHELVVPLVAAYWRSVDDLKTTWSTAIKEMPQGALDARSIGSRTMDGEHDPASGVTPRVMRAWADAISPSMLWALLGFTPRAIGVGYSGLEELKGHVPPASGPNPGSRITRDVVTDPYSRANADADDLMSTGKIPKP